MGDDLIEKMVMIRGSEKEGWLDIDQGCWMVGQVYETSHLGGKYDVAQNLPGKVLSSSPRRPAAGQTSALPNQQNKATPLDVSNGARRTRRVREGSFCLLQEGERCFTWRGGGIPRFSGEAKKDNLPRGPTFLADVDTVIPNSRCFE